MRLDKWLWAARFFKTRSLAAEAIAAGHVSVNAERAKPAKVLRVGDLLEIRRPPFTHAIVVRAFSDRRGPAAEAQALYEESAESRARRMQLAAELKASAGATPRFPGRPTKKDRRDYERWLRSNPEDDD
ncbi:MAG TPA: S4 domain-containing protein [Opitutaceae bacterium]|nr:S4 domain-containing protein [Opitutaceae bacterium]